MFHPNAALVPFLQQIVKCMKSQFPMVLCDFCTGFYSSVVVLNGFDDIISIVLSKFQGPMRWGKPDATSLEDEDFIKVATGKMNPQIAFVRYGYTQCHVPDLHFVYPCSSFSRFC